MLHAEEDAPGINGLNLVVALLVRLGDARDRLAAYYQAGRVDGVV